MLLQESQGAQRDRPEQVWLSTSGPAEESLDTSALSTEQALSLSTEDAHQDQSAVSHDWSTGQEKEV